MDNYRIGVSIALANGVSPVLAIIGRDLLGLDATAKKVEQNFSGWSKALIGVGAILAGSTVLGAMEKLVKKTAEYSDELIKLQRLGGDIGLAAANGDLSKKAFDIAQRVPMKVEDLLKIPGLTYSIVGQEDAMKIWEPLARFSWVLQSDKHYKGNSMADLQKLVRAGELSGRLTNPETHQVDVQKFDHFLDMSAKIIAATHGMVNPDTMLAMAQQGGVALRGLDDQGFYTMAIMAQAMGGHRAGTAYLSLWQQMAAGTMMKRTAEGMQEMGMLKPDEWSTEGGHVVLSKDASARLTKMIGHDPLAFAANIIEELKKKNITDPLEQMNAIMRLTGRQTTQRFTAEEVSNFHQMIAERERLMGGLPAGSSYGLINDKSIAANLEAVKNAWSNLLVAFASPNNEAAIKFMQELTRTLNGMQRAVGGISPDTMAVIFKIAAAFGAGMIALGGIALASLATLPALIGGAVVAIGTFVALNWSRISEIFGNLTHSASAWLQSESIAQWIDRNIIEPVRAWLASDTIAQMLNHGLIDPIKQFLASDSIARAFSGLGNAIFEALKAEAMKGIDFLKGLLPKGGGSPQPSDHPMGPNWVPMRFEPGSAPQRAQPISLSLNIDGRTLAQVISEQLEQLYGFPTGAPSPDGSSRYFAGDHNYSDT